MRGSVKASVEHASGAVPGSASATLAAVSGLIVAMLLWASSLIALKLAFRSYDPMLVLFGRMAIASLCLVLWVPRFRAVAWRGSDLGRVLFMALCEPCLYFLFEARALENTTASQAGVITSLLPLLVAIGATTVLGESVPRRHLAGFAVAVLGAVWLSLGGTASATAPNPTLGNLYQFLAMVCAAGYTLSLKSLAGRYPPFLLAGAQALVGSVFYLPFLLLSGTVLPARLEVVPVLAVVYLGTVVSLGAYGLYNFGVSRLPVSQAAVFVNLIPVFTVILGWLVLDEQFGRTQYAAAFLVLAGVILGQGRPATDPAAGLAG